MKIKNKISETFLYYGRIADIDMSKLIILTFPDDKPALVGRNWELDFPAGAVHLSAAAHPVVAAAARAATTGTTAAIAGFGLSNQVLDDAGRHLNRVRRAADGAKTLRRRA